MYAMADYCCANDVTASCCGEDLSPMREFSERGKTKYRIITDSLFTSQCYIFLLDFATLSESHELSQSILNTSFLQVDFIDEIASPVMPPKKEFNVTLHIKSITKGRPSICDEIELLS